TGRQLGERDGDEPTWRQPRDLLREPRLDPSPAIRTDVVPRHVPSSVLAAGRSAPPPPGHSTPSSPASSAPSPDGAVTTGDTSLSADTSSSAGSSSTSIVHTSV